MYSIKSQKKNKKIPLIILTAVFFATCIYIGAALALDIWPFKNSSISETKTISPTADEVNNNLKDTTKNTPEDTTVVSPDKTTDEVPTNTALSASIIQSEQKNGNILFTGKIDNATKPGTCVLSYTNDNDKPVSRQVDGSIKDGVVLCGPITISELEFSFLGEWNVNLKYYADDQQVSIDGKITIQ